MSITLYQNKALGVTVELPGDWEIRSHKWPGLNPDLKDVYQKSDDQVPGKPGTSLFLFTARLIQDEIHIRAAVELSVFVLGPGESITDDAPKSNPEAGLTLIVDVATEYQGHMLHHYELYDQKGGGIRFVYWNVIGNTWMEAKLQGQTDNEYDLSKWVFNTLQLNPAGGKS